MLFVKLQFAEGASHDCMCIDRGLVLLFLVVWHA